MCVYVIMVTASSLWVITLLLPLTLSWNTFTGKCIYLGNIKHSQDNCREACDKTAFKKVGCQLWREKWQSKSFSSGTLLAPQGPISSDYHTNYLNVSNMFILTPECSLRGDRPLLWHICSN